jgi:predicted TPR repeat methyltransferase
MVAAATGQDVPGRSPDDYVRTLFDDFAATFDQKLAALNYRGPELVLQALGQILGIPQGDLDVLDAGCGTGLCGPGLRPYARRLVGVDLSPAMLELARHRKVYDEIVTAELTEHLTSVPQAYDVIVAADTLIYFGELPTLFAACHQSLRQDGLLVFTVELLTAGDSGFRLLFSGRYGHSEDYLRSSLIAAGLSIVDLEQATLRQESGHGVAGLVVTARRA